MWEVGLVEISFVNSLKTIDNESIELTMQEEYSVRYVKINFLEFNFTSLRSIEHEGKKYEVIKIPQDIITPDFSIKYLKDSKRFQIQANYPETYGNITISPTSAAILGFHPGTESMDSYEIINGMNGLKTFPEVIESSHKIWTASHPPTLLSEDELILPLNYQTNNIELKSTSKIISGHNNSLIERFPIDPGYYETAEKLAAAINKTGLTNGHSISLEYDNAINRFTWNLPLGKKYVLRHLDGLENILGFQDMVTIGQTSKASHSPDLRRGIYSLYVYCDVCANSYVGNAFVPLLRTVSFNSRAFGDVISIIYDRPIYVPIIKHMIDTIGIQIHDDAGRMVPFIEGKTVITLHIRQKQL